MLIFQNRVVPTENLSASKYVPKLFLLQYLATPEYVKTKFFYFSIEANTKFWCI